MRKFLQVIVLVCIVLITAIVTRADELDDITKQLASLNAEVSNKESDKANVIKQINGIRARVTTISNEVVKKEKEVAEGEKNLAHQKKLLDERARSYYKNINKGGSAFIGLLIGENFSDSLQNFFYQKVIVDEDRNAIVKIVLYIKNLEDTKLELVEERKQLAEINSQLDKQTALLEGEIASARSKIAQLSAQQQSLIASKLSSLNIPKSAGSGAGSCSSDLTNGKDPGFGPKVGFFTYGVPNRIGLNQYGAQGRANAGQNSDAILRAYYSFDGYENFNPNINVNDGNGFNTGNIIWSGSLDEYIKRIYEVPESWHIEALKAQAIAARSYALAQTDNGNKSICANTNCQVFKTDPKTGAWAQASNDTAGQVMVQGGKPITAWYSSTHGGIIYSSSEIGWSGSSWTKHGNDTTSGIGSFGELNERAYDKESPWFYCNWGSRSEYGGTAWLRPEEVADILNVIRLVREDSSKQCMVYQPDKSPPPPDPSKGCSTTDNWSSDKVKSELRAKGITPVDSVANLSVGVDFGSGKTTSISGGGISASGDEFKNWFNLRAPANIQIVGPLYNVETR